MTETITLFHTGKRDIQYGKNAVFKPGTQITFPKTEGEYLQKLFKGELKTPDDFTTAYKGQGSVSTEAITQSRKSK